MDDGRQRVNRESWLRKAILAFQLTLPRAAIGWLFALLTSNYNRIAIHELGIAAVTITSLLALYHFLSPFQVIFGRLADRLPIFGYRRSPYILLGLLLSSLAVAGLPPATLAMSEGAPLGGLGVFLLLVLFGIGFAMSGVSHLSLVADVVPEQRRGMQVALIWAMLFVGMIVSLQFIRNFMPDFDYQRMRLLYLLSLPVVGGLTLLGLVGVEQRRTAPGPEGKARAPDASERAAKARAPGASERAAKEKPTAALLRFVSAAAAERSTRNFFLFVFIALLGIGIQDNILEVFGAQVLGMTVGETGRFQQIWGAGALAGMFAMGLITLGWAVPKPTAIAIGASGAAASLALLAGAAYAANGTLVLVALAAFGLSNGFFLVGALTAMMDLTTKRDRGAYMGLWGLSLALANGFASIVGGALVTGFIESGLASARAGYAGIFLLEAVLMLVSLHFIRGVDIRRFQRIHQEEVTAAMAADA